MILDRHTSYCLEGGHRGLFLRKGLGPITEGGGSTLYITMDKCRFQVSTKLRLEEGSGPALRGYILTVKSKGLAFAREKRHVPGLSGLNGNPDDRVLTRNSDGSFYMNTIPGMSPQSLSVRDSVNKVVGTILITHPDSFMGNSSGPHRVAHGSYAHNGEPYGGSTLFFGEDDFPF